MLFLVAEARRPHRASTCCCHSARAAVQQRALRLLPCRSPVAPLSSTCKLSIKQASWLYLVALQQADMSQAMDAVDAEFDDLFAGEVSAAARAAWQRALAACTSAERQLRKHTWRAHTCALQGCRTHVALCACHAQRRQAS